ncbi:hypothetical protein CRG98_041239 [Punica granatum]|uniref:Uncharacterized protein n=1 Tax=Punica granatum TaxID=22663 RepID=A0A2I0I301_PUNGR|nr:hypothetical protein CRG98_041239 [Punica granatum]
MYLYGQDGQEHIERVEAKQQELKSKVNENILIIAKMNETSWQFRNALLRLYHGVVHTTTPIKRLSVSLSLPLDVDILNHHGDLIENVLPTDMNFDALNISFGGVDDCGYVHDESVPIGFGYGGNESTPLLEKFRSEPSNREVRFQMLGSDAFSRCFQKRCHMSGRHRFNQRFEKASP